MIDCRLFTVPKEKPKRKRIKNSLHINFSSKNIELLNLPSILRHKDVQESLPSIAKSFSEQTIIYSLNSPISSKIFNFNKFVANLDVDRFLEDSTHLPCRSSSSPFKDSFHGHIISGDLRLVENNKLRKLFTKGPKYRERKFVDWDTIESDITNSIKECAKKWCEKNNQNSVVLDGWVSTVLEKLKVKIALLKTKKQKNLFRETLKDASCLN